MSMAHAYAMKKKKMARGGDTSCYEDGGEVKKEEDPVKTATASIRKAFGKAEGGYISDSEIDRAEGDKEKGVHKSLTGLGAGTSKAGFENERANFRSGMEKQFQRSAYGEMADEHNAAAKQEHRRVLGEMQSMRGQDRKYLAEGGEVEEMEDDLPDSDIVRRILKSRCEPMSRGGRVANDDGPIADFEENEFDDLVKRDDLEFDYTGENSGDELGNEQKDEDERDVVRRIMKSRNKKDRMPHPA